MLTTLIDPATLASHIADDTWLVVDSRFHLTDPAQRQQKYLDGHTPGASNAHIDRHLSGRRTGTNGRHPLPTPEQMRERSGARGIAPGTQVVAYNADTGMYAAR